MKKFVVITLFLALTIVGISALSAISPDSPSYDAWKRNQVYTPEVLLAPSQPSHPFDIVDNQAKDQCELLVPWDSTFTLAMAPNDDGSTGQIFLPFTFTFYGTPNTWCWINNNGNVTFDYGLSSFTPWGFPSGDNPMLAPFFADVDTRAGGSVWYKLEANRMIIIWDHVGYYGYHIDKVNTFELIFSDGTDPLIGLGNNVAFSYADMAWTTGDASSGVGGFGGSAATVGINKGDNINYAQIGRFDHPGIDYDGPFDLNDGVDWLDCQLFLFNTGGQASNVAPIFVTIPPSPIELTVGDVWSFDVTVISPEVGQLTNAVISHDFPMNYTIVPATTLTFTMSVTASAADIGTHLVTITATDDGIPNLSSTYEFEIIIQPATNGFTYFVESHEYDTVLETPFGPDLNAEILFNGVSFAVPIYTPYTFGLVGNYPYVAGTYSVYHPGFMDWQPVSVTFDTIEMSWETDFWGIPETVPVELSSFTATLTANRNVRLTWVSQSESNMWGYRVYRSESADQANLLMITPNMYQAGNTSSTQTYNHVDNEVEVGTTYYYWLETVEYNSNAFHGPVSVTVDNNTTPVLPDVTAMKSAYPNPFRTGSSTSIEVSLKESGTVTIYNILGQVVRTFAVSPGNNTITWNGKDSRGSACGNGIYFYKLSTPNFNETRKMVIVK